MIESRQKEGERELLHVSAELQSRILTSQAKRKKEGPQQEFSNPAFLPFFLLNPAIPPLFTPGSRPTPFFYEILDIFCLIIEIGVMTYLLTIVSFDASQLATITLFSVLLNYFFVLALVHVFLDTLSPVFLELGRLMLSVCLTKIRLLCCQFPSGDEANSVNCLHGVQDMEIVYKHTGLF